MPNALLHTEDTSSQAIAHNFARVLRVTQTHWPIARATLAVQSTQPSVVSHPSRDRFSRPRAKPVLALELAWQWGG